MDTFIGCAGWQLRKHAANVPATGTHLERYANQLNCVEINSSFYRSHRFETYQRWAASTPHNFRFAVKLPKQISHVRRLSNVEAEIEQFAAETSGLGEKLGPILVQLPPSLPFDIFITEQFFQSIRCRISSSVVCEPRHSSWFEREPEALMEKYEIDRVAADPAIVPAAAAPGGWGTTGYFRLHGSPRMYYSRYDDQTLISLAHAAKSAAKGAAHVWCIFDNTAEGHALNNALLLRYLLETRDG